ncbi:MAG: hypothetical protein IKM21_04360 [Oscillospiraceae bacterium]|nr:hypothetical protein [Oscillospiraceae bacterium]
MKKFLSIILAVVMIASLLPATFMTAAAAEPTDLNYVFAHKAHTSSALNGPLTPGYVAGGTDIRKGTSFVDVGFDDMDTTVSSGAWGNKGHRDGQGQEYTAFDAPLAVHRSGDFVNFVFNVATQNSEDGFYKYDSYRTYAPIVIIAIDVPVSGTYIPALNAGGFGANGQLHELFLVKETEENKDFTAYEIREALRAAERIGVYDASVGGEQKFLEHYLDKGVYYLCFVPNGKGANTGASISGTTQTGMSLKSFHLYAKEEVEMEEYDPSKLGGDGKIKYSFTASAFNIANRAPKLNADGEPVDAEGNVVTNEEDYIYEWHYGDSDADILAYSRYINSSTTSSESPLYEQNGVPAQTSGFPLNTWTDKSAEAQAAGKYIPWAGESITGAWMRRRESLWRIYPEGNGKAYLQGTYDYINSATSGDWQYVKSSNMVSGQNYVRGEFGLHFQVTNANLKALGSGEAYQVVKVNVPTAAKYTVEVTPKANANKPGVAVYMIPATETLPTTYAGREDYLLLAEDWLGETYTATYNALKAGEYYIIIEAYRGENTSTTFTSNWDMDFNSITLTALGDPAEEVSPELEAKRAAMVLDEGNPDKETLEDKNATINVLARAVGTDEDDDDIADVIDTETVVAGATYTTPEAPEIPGYKFLYWGRGLGTKMRPVSTDATATIKASQGANYIAAFYSKDEATDAVVEFYNANGELVDRTRYDDGDEITIPALPSLTGVGTAKGWTDDAGETVIGAEAVVYADGPIMAFFAVYDEEAIAKDIEITVSGSTGITGAGTYAFGDVVTLTAPARENGNGYNMFLYWKKGDEIVSFDRKYSFNAAKECEVTAVYAKYGPTSVDALRKILVSTVGETVVAEFIGCENALERGFVFDTAEGQYKKAMTTDSTSFSMINDVATAVARAYAIFADGVIFSK